MGGRGDVRQAGSDCGFCLLFTELWMGENVGRVLVADGRALHPITDHHVTAAVGSSSWESSVSVNMSLW